LNGFYYLAKIVGRHWNFFDKIKALNLYLKQKFIINLIITFKFFCRFSYC